MSTLQAPFPPPARKSGYHLAYLNPTSIVICSDAVEVEVQSLASLLESLTPLPESAKSVSETERPFGVDSEKFAKWLKGQDGDFVGRHLYGVLLPTVQRLKQEKQSEDTASD